MLRTKGKRIRKANEEIRRLAADMLETLHEANGVGLAAQQVGEAVQLTVIDVSEAENRPSKMWIDGKEVDPEAHAAHLAQSGARIEPGEGDRPRGLPEFPGN